MADPLIYYYFYSNELIELFSAQVSAILDWSLWDYFSASKDNYKLIQMNNFLLVKSNACLPSLENVFAYTLWT